MKILVDKMPKTYGDCPFCHIDHTCQFTRLACSLKGAGCPYFRELNTLQTPEDTYKVKVGSDADKDRLNTHGIDWR